MVSTQEDLEHVHIVFLGGRDEHVGISLDQLNANALHIITSTDYQKEAEVRISEWCKQFKIREGTVQVVADIFESTAVQSLLGAVFKIMDHEEERGTENVRWLVGITGGTQLMGAVAAYAANIIGGSPYYVRRIKEGDEFLPGGKPIIFPDLTALGSLLDFKKQDLRDLLAKEGGTLTEVVEVGDELFRLVQQLRSYDLVLIDEENKQWSLTEIGKATIAVALEGPRDATRTAVDGDDDEEDEMEDEEDPIDEIGERVYIIKEISDHNCHCPIYAEALRIHGLTVRAELWTWEEQDYLLLRTYDSTTGEAKKLDSEHPLYSSFKEKRIAADMETLVSKFLDFSTRHILIEHAGISKKRIAELISTDNTTMLMGLLASVWLVRKYLIPFSDIKLGDPGVDR